MTTTFPVRIEPSLEGRRRCDAGDPLAAVAFDTAIPSPGIGPRMDGTPVHALWSDSPLDDWLGLGSAGQAARVPPVDGSRLSQPALRAGWRRREERRTASQGDRVMLARVLAAMDARLREREERLGAALRREQAVTRTLRTALAPQSLPECPGYRIAAAYHPSPGQGRVGGDFYDVFRLPEGRTGLLVGDVAGKGLGAAAYAGMARYMARAYALQTAAPGEMLGQLNRGLCESLDDPSLFVTAIYAVLCPSSLTVRLASAGHWPGLLVSAGGAETIGTRSLALGITPEAAYEEEERPLGAGDGLLLYTDGLVELDGHDPEERLQAVQATLERSGKPDPRRWIEALYADALEQGGGMPRDDLTLLALRRTVRTPPAAAASP
jgi:serine phosphatase RsbU (regulator of sigma subunit)